MVVYPTADFNSYVSQADADTIALNYLNEPLWTALTSIQKDQYLMQAFRVINMLTGFTAPDETVPDDVTCLKTAQVEIVLNDLKYGLSESKQGGREAQVASLSAGPTSISYFEMTEQEAVSVIPPESISCLESFGVTSFCSGGAIGSIRKIR